MGHYLANTILFYLERYADWQSHLNMWDNGGCWRAGRHLRGNMPRNLKYKERRRCGMQNVGGRWKVA